MCGTTAVVKVLKGEALGPLVQLINIRDFPFLFLVFITSLNKAQVGLLGVVVRDCWATTTTLE